MSWQLIYKKLLKLGVVEGEIDGKKRKMTISDFEEYIFYINSMYVK